MSHTYLIELYEYIGNRKREQVFAQLDETLPRVERKAAEGADAFLSDALEFFSTSYHGKLPKRLRVKHPPEGYLPG